MTRKAIRGVMAMLAVGLAPASSMAEQSKGPTLELIGMTAIPHDTRFQGIAVGGLSGLYRLPGGGYLVT